MGLSSDRTWVLWLRELQGFGILNLTKNLLLNQPECVLFPSYSASAQRSLINQAFQFICTPVSALALYSVKLCSSCWWFYSLPPSFSCLCSLLFTHFCWPTTIHIPEPMLSQNLFHFLFFRINDISRFLKNILKAENWKSGIQYITVEWNLHSGGKAMRRERTIPAPLGFLWSLRRSDTGEQQSVVVSHVSLKIGRRKGSVAPSRLTCSERNKLS